MKAGNFRVYEQVADCFAKEDVDTVFALMGHANMLCVTSMATTQKMKVIYTRHEHTACAAAMGYFSATGKVGVASVTSGPGFTQIMTALTSAAKNHVPMVVLAGETPLTGIWSEQYIDQRPFAVACGAAYIAAHSVARVQDCVREAFHVARTQRIPVVLGIPYDLQDEIATDQRAYISLKDTLSSAAAIPPDPGQIATIATELANARHPIIIAGRGALESEAQPEIENLADVAGALLGTTLLAKGMFDHHPFSLGISGGYSRAIAREMFLKADLVVTFGASLTSYTADKGRLFPNARVIQVDTRPLGYQQGLATADLVAVSDARLMACALIERLATLDRTEPSVRTEALAERIRQEPADAMVFDIDDGTLDPRKVFEVLEAVLPKDFDLVSGSGHAAYFHTTMRGYAPQRYHAMRNFGAIGNGLAFGIGVEVARGNGRTAVFEGDGSFAMYAQEMETLKRHGIKLLVVCANDGAYGAEVHKMRKDGIEESGAVFGRADFESVARAYGLRGTKVTATDALPSLMDAYLKQPAAEVWNVHISDQVVSPWMRLSLE